MSDRGEPEERSSEGESEGGAESEGEADVPPDPSSVAPRQELRRRIRAERAQPPERPRPAPGGGRHARPDGTEPTDLRLDYVPRHAKSMPGPSAVSAGEVTEQFPRIRQDPTEPSMPNRPAPPEGSGSTTPGPDPSATGTAIGTRVTGATDAGGSTAERDPTPLSRRKRVRVVLAQRAGSAWPVRTVVEVQELTPVGAMLSTSLIRSQLALALRVGGIAVIALGSLPAIFVIFPVLGRMELFGLRLPWLLLGVLSYPFMITLGYLHSRSAEKLEQVFADHIKT